MKNPGSAPDRKVEWSVLILFLLSDPAHGHTGWLCPGHLELERGGEGECSLGAFVLSKHLSFTDKLIWPYASRLS